MLWNVSHYHHHADPRLSDLGETPSPPSSPSVSPAEIPTPSSRMPWITVKRALPWPNTRIHPFRQPVSQAGDPGVGGLEPCWAPRLSFSPLHPHAVSSDSLRAPPDCLFHYPEAPLRQSQGPSLILLLAPTSTPLNLMPSTASSPIPAGIPAPRHILPLCSPDPNLSLCTASSLVFH